MTSQLVLMVGHDPQSPAPILLALSDLPRSKVLWVGMADQAIGLVEQEKPSLVLAIGGPEHDPTGFGDLIACCVAEETSVPVLVVSDTYDEAEATAFFQMGVADYLSQAHHAEQILPVAATLLRQGPLRGLSPKKERIAGRSKRPRIREVSPMS